MLQHRTLIKLLLVVAVAALVTVAVVREMRNEAATATVLAASAETPQKSPQVIAYYFHATYRCATCRKIEAFSREAIEQGFANALKEGKLELRVVNIDEEANRHFARDYQLFTKSLILVKVKDGKQAEWKNLRRVWELVNRKDAFLSYVQDEVRSYLEAS